MVSPSWIKGVRRIGNPQFALLVLPAAPYKRKILTRRLREDRTAIASVQQFLLFQLLQIAADGLFRHMKRLCQFSHIHPAVTGQHLHHALPPLYAKHSKPPLWNEKYRFLPREKGIGIVMR